MENNEVYIPEIAHRLVKQKTTATAGTTTNSVTGGAAGATAATTPLKSPSDFSPGSSVVEDHVAPFAVECLLPPVAIPALPGAQQEVNNSSCAVAPESSASNTGGGGPGQERPAAPAPPQAYTQGFAVFSLPTKTKVDVVRKVRGRGEGINVLLARWDKGGL
jgi:hypothetical protein